MPDDDLKAAYMLIERLQSEIVQLGDALVLQQQRYENTLDAEREERRALIRTSSSRTRRLTRELDRLTADNQALRKDHRRIGAAYRDSLATLRRAFQQQVTAS